jgi:hypothetical protein
MSWIGNKVLGGWRRLLDGDGLPVPLRSALKIVGATLTDNPTEDRTELVFDTAPITDATHLATPSKIVKRSVTGSASFAGVSVFEDVNAEEVAAIGFAWRVEIEEERVLHATPASKDAEWSPAAEGKWLNETVGGLLQVPLPELPNGVRLDEVRVTIDPAGGHGALPGTMPSVELRAWNADTLTDDLIGSATDSSATTGAYEAAHEIAVSPTTAHVVGKGIRRYRVDLIAESGAGSDVGTVYVHAIARFTRLEGAAAARD